MSDWSERRESGRADTATAEPPRSLPLARPFAVHSMILPGDGGFALRPQAEGSVSFAFPIEWGDAAFGFTTTGFDGQDAVEGQDAPPIYDAVEPAEICPPEKAPVEFAAAVPPPPVLEIITPPVNVAIFEPLEIMDYEDFDSDQYFEAQPEPEPEPEPPALCVELCPVAIHPAVPGVPVPLAPVGPLPYGELEPGLPELHLHAVRPRVLLGRNPNAPVAPMVEEPAAVESEAPKPAPAPEKPKVSVRPTPEKDRRSRAVRPAARDHGNAVPVERDEPSPLPVAPPPPPVSKPKVMPMPSRRTEPAPDAAPIPARAPAARSDEGPALTLPSSEGGMAGGLKLAIAGVALAVLAGGGYFAFSGGEQKAAVANSETTASNLIVGGGGWTTTWGNDAPTNRNKQISIYRPSMAITDYRFEFRGQIERKALGWVFRAADAKNYYVMKLETIKPGASPLVALVKYAIIGGKETTRTQVMLPFDVKLDTLYSVRVDVRGDKFSTYVQDKLVDFWTDSRIKVGGAGFYNDAGERASIKSSQLSYLSAAAQ